MTDPTYGEIINPSDAYTICVDDRKAACIAVFSLGLGQYSIQGPDGTDVLPMFFFGGFREWFLETFDDDADQYVEDNRGAVAAALESVCIGNRRERDLIAMHVPEEGKAAFFEDWHDKHRSSMNDIGGRAAAMAAALRKKLSGPVPTQAIPDDLPPFIAEAKQAREDAQI